MFRNKACFYGEDLSTHRPTSKLEDRTLSAVRDCLFNLFTATLHIGGRSSIRNLRTCHAVVTGTHLLRRIQGFGAETWGKNDHLEDPGIDGRIILRWIFRMWRGKEGGGMDWTDLAQDRVRWQALGNVVMNLQVPKNGGNFLTSWELLSFSRRTLLHGISKVGHKTFFLHSSLTTILPSDYIRHLMGIRVHHNSCSSYTKNVSLCRKYMLDMTVNCVSTDFVLKMQRWY